VQFLAAGQDGDQDFCLRRHLVRCALRAKSPRSAPSGRQLLRAWRRGFAGRAGGDCRAVLAAHGKEKVYGSIP
jgi:hypothetical protein